jgi:3-hydroxyacyl-CoA dehydrogenase
MRTLGRVAVLGAGTMGSRIAAHFANAGIPALLLDVVRPGSTDRSAAARQGIEQALKQRPAGFYAASKASLVTPGNFEDDLDKIADCDWIIEAVKEDLEIKRALWTRVQEIRRPGSILSTNTSGIPLARITEGMRADFRAHFLGTHFFNPPRYLHLAEIIPGRDTDSAVLAFVREFCDRRLGKGVVICKDTPNFIANRIGSMFGAATYHAMMESGLSIEEVDALTGPLIGVPRTATFRLVDLVGLDVWALVSQNLYDLIPNDPWRERIAPPLFLKQMIERGWLGDKAGQGFYKRVGPNRDMHVIDWRTLEYHPLFGVSLPAAEAVRKVADLPERLRALVQGTDQASTFLWRVLRDVLLYTASLVPEISDRIVEVDRAMRWGYGHELGPFQLWDALGFEVAARRMEAEGHELPPIAVNMLVAGARSFYRTADENGRPRTEYFDVGTTTYLEMDPPPGSLSLSDLKRSRGVVDRNAAASLIDLGDGVLCLEFHSKANAITEETLALLASSLQAVRAHHAALVIANDAADFSTGTLWGSLLAAAREGQWSEVEGAIGRHQQALRSIKGFERPVVMAPFGRVQGTAAEWLLHATHLQAHAELAWGFPDVAMGLVPVCGGLTALLARGLEARRAFDLVSAGTTSSSAEEAREWGLLRAVDAISMNRDRLLQDAKLAALRLATNHAAEFPTAIHVGGETAYAEMQLAAWQMKEAGKATDHDVVIAEKLAHVLSGGRLTGTPSVPESYLLELEREAALSLLGMEKSQQRLESMITSGKPLRN